MRVGLLVLVALASAPGIARATAHSCAVAMDVPDATLVSAGLLEGTGDMVTTSGALGNWSPILGPSACVLSTGVALSPSTGGDMPPAGLQGDEARLRLELSVPASANSLFLRSHLFSFDAWAGPIRDRATVEIVGASWSGELLVSAANEPMFDDGTFFDVFELGWLVGTGFEGQGLSTGWFVSGAPVTPGDLITLDFGVADGVDGNWDTALVLDAFEWSTTVLNEGFTSRSDGAGAPTEELWLPVDSAPLLEKVVYGPVSVRDPERLFISGGPMLGVSEVTVNSVPVEFTVSSASRLLASMPAGDEIGLAEGGLAELSLVGPFGELVFPETILYELEPLPLRLFSVEPSQVAAGFRTEVTVRGTALDGASWGVSRPGGDDTLEPLGPVTPADADGVQEVRLDLPGLSAGDHSIWADRQFESTSYVSVEAVDRRRSACSIQVRPDGHWHLGHAVGLLVALGLRRRRSPGWHSKG